MELENVDTNVLYADNGAAESASVFAGGTLTLTTDDLLPDPMMGILGVKKETITDNTIKTEGASWLKASSVAIDAFTAKSTTFSRRGTWGTGLNKPAFMLTMKCDYGSISSNRNFAQCGAYKLGTTRRQSDSITQNKEMPMYGWVSLVEAYFVDSNYTTTVRYITW